VFNVDKAGPTYLPYNKDEVFEKFTDIEYINFFIYGTKRECDEEEIKYKLSKLNILFITTAAYQRLTGAILHP